MKLNTIKVVILGAGGTGRDIVDIVVNINSNNGECLEIIGFLDDNPELSGEFVMNYPILGTLDLAGFYSHHKFANGLGSPSSFRNRHLVIEKLKLMPDQFINIIHSSVQMAPSASLGSGLVIYPNVVIMSNARIKNHVTILSNSTINHDVEIGDYSIIASGVQISGEVGIGKSCYIGTGASLIQKIKVGDSCLIGMGSVLLESIPSHSKAFGNPSKLKS